MYACRPPRTRLTTHETCRGARNSKSVDRRGALRASLTHVRRTGCKGPALDFRKTRGTNILKRRAIWVEASPGIEPRYTDLQSGRIFDLSNTWLQNLVFNGNH